MIFWVDNRYSPPSNGPTNNGANGQVIHRTGSSIYGYNVASQSEFLVTSSADEKPSIATDGQTLVWVETQVATSSAPPINVIKTYKVATGIVSTLITAPNADLGSLALDGGNLYYMDNASGHTGLYARNLTTGAETLITSASMGGIAVNSGRVLWIDQQYRQETNFGGAIDGDQYQSPSTVTATLHLSTWGGTTPDRIVASAQGCLNGYSISGDTILYAYGCDALDIRAYKYSANTGISTAISTGPASFPLVSSSGNTILWTQNPEGAIGETKAWSVQRYDASTNAIASSVAASSAQLRAEALFDDGRVVVSVEDDATRASHALYLTNVSTPANQSLPSFQDNTPEPSVLTTCNRNHPSTCGQVRYANWAGGRFFIDDGGYWPMDGIHFRLPGTDINGDTFTSGIYNAALNDGSLEYWLGVAQTQLLAKTLRIYVSLPSENSATCLNCLIDFANRADNHGMRLGIVMRNSTAQLGINGPFLDAFFNAFSPATGYAQKIAYLSIENEANNHASSSCDFSVLAQGRTMDCFDRYYVNNGDRTYINRVMHWAYDWTGYYSRHYSPILRTVGISTEMGNGDAHPAENDFFRQSTDIVPGTSNTYGSLSDYVDFLSPHNYGGQAASIVTTLRYNPLCWQCNYYPYGVMLEEFGWPTDDKHDSGNYQDGYWLGSVCRSNPLGNRQICFNTAPYIVESNAAAVRASGPAGYSGSAAFMLTDVEGTQCIGASNYKFDKFTGLFTANMSAPGRPPNEGYCGGTYHPYLVYPKDTAYRINIHHQYYNPHP